MRRWNIYHRSATNRENERCHAYVVDGIPHVFDCHHNARRMHLSSVRSVLERFLCHGKNIFIGYDQTVGKSLLVGAGRERCKTLGMAGVILKVLSGTVLAVRNTKDRVHGVIMFAPGRAIRKMRTRGGCP